ncbi:MAG: hypothetical protein WDM79_07195 [Terricaulis sp.]
MRADLERERTDMRASVKWRIAASIEGLLERLGLRPQVASARRAQDEEVTEIRASALFDEAWYVAQYPEAVGFWGGPIRHYLTEGWRANRNPSPLFDTAFYIANNPDVRRDKINPLIHFIRTGKSENRLPGAAYRARHAAFASHASAHLRAW